MKPIKRTLIITPERFGQFLFSKCLRSKYMPRELPIHKIRNYFICESILLSTQQSKAFLTLCHSDLTQRQPPVGFAGEPTYTLFG